MVGRDDNPIPTRFLAPIDCLKLQHWVLYPVNIRVLGEVFTTLCGGVRVQVQYPL